MSEARILALRREKDEFFKLHPQSPLTPEQKQDFGGLHYYAYNPALDLLVQVERFAQSDEILMQTTTGTVKPFERYGQFRFEVEGQKVGLTLYQADYGYFLPFVDAGAGTETYPAGRYLEPEPLGGDRFHVDFNEAYSPYCAYNEFWACPITPAENRLSIYIKAGEKLPSGTWVNQD
jgi:uncharacterized protein (DUF1684 family)